MKITPLIAKADAYASAAHAAMGQKRKYTGEPYIVHPRRVASLVSPYVLGEHVIAAALLHDVVEDTPISLRQIHAEFGPSVAELVYHLTDRSRPEDGNRAARKAIDRRHLAEAPADAQTVKLADLIDNTHDIVAYDRDFARVYLSEKALLLDVLTKGHPALWLLAKAQLEHANKALNFKGNP